MIELTKTIWLLWLQGWDKASWLNKQVVESWEINNPDWKVECVTLDNLKNYVSDIDYLYDKNKNISPQAKSDIIRLSLLKNHGGVWADATMLCMQPLDHWIYEAISPAGLWMYHGHGGGMAPEIGPASWFIVSVKNGYLINKWKSKCDEYWNNNDSSDNYFWMDNLFRHLFETNEEFKNLWLKVPYLYCEMPGQSHYLAYNDGMFTNIAFIKELILNKPPYALKFWKSWNDIFSDINNERCKNSNGYYAIQMSKRKFIYKHKMT